MKTRIIAAAVLVPVFFCILFVFPPIILTFTLCIICPVAAYELLNAAKINKNKRVLVYSIIAAALTPFAVFLSTLAVPFTLMMLFTLVLTIFFFLFCFLFVEFFLTFKSTNPKTIEKRLKLLHIPVVLCAGILIPLCLSALISLKTMPYGHLFVLLPVISAVFTDSGAYFVGVFMGKNKAFPTISPNKTVEGCIGGIIIGTLAVVIYGTILENSTPLNIIIPATAMYGFIGAIVTELGDLLFSLIKRKCGIKDYGKLIPGHGGILDRLDSMVLCAPVMYLLVTFVPAIIL